MVYNIHNFAQLHWTQTCISDKQYQNNERKIVYTSYTISFSSKSKNFSLSGFSPLPSVCIEGFEVVKQWTHAR